MKVRIITLGLALFIALSVTSIAVDARPHRFYGSVVVTRSYPVYHYYRPYYRPYRPVVYRSYYPYYRPRSSFSFVIASRPAYSTYYVRHRRYCGYRGYYGRY